MWFIPSTFFPAGHLKLWYTSTLSKACLHDQLPIKILGTDSPMSVPKDIFYTLSQFVVKGIKHVLCDFTGREL